MASRPNLVKRRLGRRLTRLRTQANLTPQDVANARIDISKSKLWRIETGQAAKVTMGDVLALCRKYNVQDRKLENELTRMAQESGERGWWEPYGEGVPAWFQLFVELEQDAAEMWVYESEFVNGLFQTEAYMRATYARDPLVSQDVAEQAVALRLARQRDYWNGNLRRVHWIMSEAVIRRTVGGKETHDEQLKYLLTMTERPGVDVYVVPDSTGAHPSMSRTYTVMQFDDVDDPNVVYSEAIDGSRYDDTEATFRRCRTTFDATQEPSIPIKEFLK